MSRALLLTMAAILHMGCNNSFDADPLSYIEKAAGSSDFWVKVHGIEYLIALGEHKKAKRFVDGEFSKYADSSQKRIGVWRVMYRLETDGEIRDGLLKRIIQAYVDQDGADRIHAAETLAKLNFSLQNLDDDIIQNDIQYGGMLGAFVRWGYSLSNAGTSNRSLLLELMKEESEMQKLSAYALGFIGNLSNDEWVSITVMTLKTDTGSVAYPYLLGMLYSVYDRSLNLQPHEYTQVKLHLLNLKNREFKDARIELCRALATHSERDDVLILHELLKDDRQDAANLDVKAAAAYALLQERRK